MKAHGTVTSRLRDIRVVATILALAVIGATLVAIAASAGESQQPASPPGPATTVDCPTVADKLPDVPASAVADVQQELAALEAQITNANDRLITTEGQGGPNFIDNAILGPLADRRTATLERIEIAIGRHAERPTGLTDLAECTLSQAGNGQEDGSNGAGEGSNGAGDIEDAGAGGDDGNGAGDDPPPAPPTAGVPTVDCPSVAEHLPAIPAAATADVQQELAALEAQITNANDRLITTEGRGGPNFIDNAILGPLADRRTATLERIEIAIGRHTERPTGLTDLAECTLNQG